MRRHRAGVTGGQEVASSNLASPTRNEQVRAGAKAPALSEAPTKSCSGGDGHLQGLGLALRLFGHLALPEARIKDNEEGNEADGKAGAIPVCGLGGPRTSEEEE